MVGGSELEEILGSRARVRILGYLLRVGESNITRISRETGVHHSVARRYLEELSRLGMVEEISIGRMRIYRVVWSNIRVRLLKSLIESVESGE